MIERARGMDGSKEIVSSKHSRTNNIHMNSKRLGQHTGPEKVKAR